MSHILLSIRRPALVLTLLIVALLLLALPLYRPTEVPFLFLFVGRLHPLILHFPIVLIILALLFEVAGRFYRLKVGDNTVMILLIAAAISALVSIAAGFFLFASGDYSGSLMEQHFWAGAITGAAIFVTLALFYVHRNTTRYYYLYFGGLLFANGAVGLTSHLGGSITHGEDYLTEHLEFVFHTFDDEEGKDESRMLVYEDMIVPIFEAKCISCHNSRRAKGNLVLGSRDNMLKKGDSGLPSITPGDPLESEVYKRVMLPEGHSDRMPPEGKMPLSGVEIDLLKFWIASGATDTLKASDAAEIDSMAAIVTGLLPELAKYRRRARVREVQRAKLERELQDVAEKLDIVIRPDSLSDEDLFAISMKFPPAPFTTGQFRELSPYFEVFSKASLISSGIDDAGLYYIGQMVNVRELYLQKTGIDGSGIIHLQSLPHLEVLNLSFTKVDDKAVIDLLEFPSLKEVYLYRTNTSMQMIEALRKYKPGVRYLLEEGPYY